jgi:hypothetical protein
MTLYEFTGLNKEQQAIEVWDSVFVDVRTWPNGYVLL